MKILNFAEQRCRGKTFYSRHKVNGAPVVFESKMYGLVFVDPPYAATADVRAGSRLDRLLDLLHQQVTDDCIVVVRTHERISLLDEYGEFGTVERRQWGTMTVTILQKGGR